MHLKNLRAHWADICSAEYFIICFSCPKRKKKIRNGSAFFRVCFFLHQFAFGGTDHWPTVLFPFFMLVVAAFFVSDLAAIIIFGILSLCPFLVIANFIYVENVIAKKGEEFNDDSDRGDNDDDPEDPIPEPPPGLKDFFNSFSPKSLV